jgi:hypothetical protein
MPSLVRPRVVGTAVSLIALASVFACARGDRPASRADEIEIPSSDDPPTGFDSDAGTTDGATDGGFATCASAAVEAARSPLPVDIIWVVDNSASMAPAVTQVQLGLNTFAGLVGNKGLDYRVIMLSLRGSSPVTVGGRLRYPVCIPPPLGGADCGSSATFSHASLDVQSTQPLEQLLGTLDQTQGYTAGTQRGSEPWSQVLRPGATKSIVLVTDDNSRFPAPSFETFPGGDSPYTSGLVLPPGLLAPSRAGAWKGYVFNAIYGWGDADPSIRCTYPDNTKPAASGSEYTELVQKTGGVRAKICDGTAAWGPFFDAVATAVVATARVACDVAIPPPDAGKVDPELVNVRVTDGNTTPITVPRVAGESACGGLDGWYYDSPTAPTRVNLCPKSCEAAQSQGGSGVPKLEVLFGCATVVR